METRCLRFLSCRLRFGYGAEVHYSDEGSAQRISVRFQRATTSQATQTEPLWDEDTWTESNSGSHTFPKMRCRPHRKTPKNKGFARWENETASTSEEDHTDPGERDKSPPEERSHSPRRTIRRRLQSRESHSLRRRKRRASTRKRITQPTRGEQDKHPPKGRITQTSGGERVGHPAEKIIT
ncbi:Ras guanyl-releasing protein 3 [Bagarius yarrelli]|uniref:Ras guanyl-releasing protein 3 n=1 Tax=Bagarius yarrelli TaxID=175774 RepID=A0A556VX04_BAGYA|nr:Ras guanyl-releasing protein 3 [Bagarius yarrelli]